MHLRVYLMHAETPVHTHPTAASGNGNVRVWGTQPDAIDEAEDRDRCVVMW